MVLRLKKYLSRTPRKRALLNILSSIKRFLIGPLPSDDATSGVASEEPPESVAFRAASTVRALERILSRGMDIGTVVDIGASNGMWSAAAEALFPHARFLLVEAQRGHLDALNEYMKHHPRAEYVLAAAGDEHGEAFFNDSSLFGGVACKEQTVTAKCRVPMITIDDEVQRRNLTGPFLVKLDTHGFEVPILRGAKKTLKSANLVVIEAYNFRIEPNALLFHEMCRYMEELGFGVIDISEPLWRTYDRSFWQIDIFFVPLDRKEFSYVSYA